MAFCIPKYTYDHIQTESVPDLHIVGWEGVLQLDVYTDFTGGQISELKKVLGGQLWENFHCFVK